MRCCYCYCCCCRCCCTNQLLLSVLLHCVCNIVLCVCIIQTMCSEYESVWFCVVVCGGMENWNILIVMTTATYDLCSILIWFVPHHTTSVTLPQQQFLPLPLPLPLTVTATDCHCHWPLQVCCQVRPPLCYPWDVHWGEEHMPFLVVHLRPGEASALRTHAV